MKRALCHVMACTLALAEVTGCAKAPAEITPFSSRQITEDQRSKFGTIAVASISARPEGGLNTPIVGRGAGAAVGAAGGAAQGVSAGLSSIVLIPAFLVVGAVIGGIAGAVNAIPANTAKTIEQKIALALETSDPQNAIRRDVLEIALSEGVAAETKLINAGALAANDPASDQRLRTLDVDTILEVGVTQVGLEGMGGSDPDLELVVQASVRLLNAKTGAVLYENKNLEQIGPRYSFTEWGANNAALLTTQLQSAYRGFANTIVDRVFLEFH